jgi:photosystem II stability/assembly factor-like uncharacterized protein
MRIAPFAVVFLLLSFAIGFSFVIKQSAVAGIPSGNGLANTPQKITGFAGPTDTLLSSADGGKTWQQATVAPAEMERAGSGRKSAIFNGVIIATGQQGIRRSTDDGKTWQWVVSEGGVGIDVALIKGGFAAITYNTQSKTRRIRASYDGGISWQAIDEGLQSAPLQSPANQLFANVYFSASAAMQKEQLPQEAFISSIVEVDGYFLCGHPKGIFKSEDKGKTWHLLQPSVEGKVYLLHVQDNVIYALARNTGC